ncbi:MAG: excinuclease ABC subunit UvrC [Candidatus Aureabacteria bacterium]|nr:excinuclease ABC subunit UvrC [Candidatus Auribacterota bacterium]
MISRDKLKRLPRKPGVYLMKSASGDVLYVGKAIDLRRRVSAHVRNRGGSQPLVPAAIPHADEIDYIVTDTEKEALLLENNLIKEHRPRYNVRLKDDAAYAHIRLSVNEEYPALTITRKLRKDGARYFGPYSSADAARKTLRFLQKVFPLRSCSGAELSRRTRPCVKYEIRRCSGPCCGMISGDGYQGLVDRVTLFLSGRTGSLLSLLEKEMSAEAARMNYERAGAIRDTLGAIRKTVERQKSVSHDGADRDAIGVYREGTRGEAAILCVRGGRLIGKRTIALEGIPGDDVAVTRGILINHYLGCAYIPPEILVPALPADRVALESLLAGERGGGAVRILAPCRGATRALVTLASTNAEASFVSRGARELEWEQLLDEMRRRFSLAAPPRRIECVDVSNIGGSWAVGAVVVFSDGAPCKEDYRHFHIKVEGGADDCRMIYEVLARRIRRATHSGALPHLVVVDGGKGQLHAAVRALSDLGTKGIRVIALAKERETGGRKRPERVFLEGRKNAVPMTPGSSVTLFLQRVRDEAHRFAIGGHRGVRMRRLLASELEGIEGIGDKRSALLLSRFGDIKGVARAPVEELRRALGNSAVARRVRAYFLGRSGKR